VQRMPTKTAIVAAPTPRTSAPDIAATAVPDSVEYLVSATGRARRRMVPSATTSRPAGCVAHRGSATVSPPTTAVPATAMPRVRRSTRTRTSGGVECLAEFHG